jgi:hypothetical protein
MDSVIDTLHPPATGCYRATATLPQPLFAFSVLVSSDWMQRGILPDALAPRTTRGPVPGSSLYPVRSIPQIQ